jgi:chemotaxis protein methyltransferase CheR
MIQRPALLELDYVKPLAPLEFEQIRQLAYRTFGLDLKTGKEELVSARLRKLVRGGGFHSFEDYYQSIVLDTTGTSLLAMIDALATNHTSFLREAEHFQFLRETVLPGLGTRNLVEIWTAACSTGEEVWTLAMVLNEAMPGRKIRIHASDISNKALSLAQRAAYPVEQCKGISAPWLARYFVAEGRPPSSYRVNPGIRAQASFRRVNLVEAYSWPQQFPIIFCRNVMIYFDRATQEKVVAGLSRHLEPGGYLFVGHAESLTQVAHSLEYVKPAVYRKAGKKEVEWNRSL